VRESPALDIIELLRAKGARVSYHDPHGPCFHHDGLAMTTVADLESAWREADCVVIATDHTAYAWATLSRQARLIVDTRHVLNGGSMKVFPYGAEWEGQFYDKKEIRVYYKTSED